MQKNEHIDINFFYRSRLVVETVKFDLQTYVIYLIPNDIYLDMPAVIFVL